MEMPEWRKEYTVGVPELDRQHQYLFRLGAKLARAAQCDDSYINLADIIRDLENYANEHFELEEKIMEQAGYEHVGYHRAMHEFMRTRLTLLKAQLAKGLYGREELTEFMESWLTEHIIMEDMRYIPVVAAMHNQGGYP